MVEKGCEDCDYFVKHDSYDFFGLCLDEDRLITKKERCRNQKDIDIERIEEILKEKGWIYCISCGEPIFTLDELDDHKKGRLASEKYTDEVASEDSPAAD